MSELNPRQFGKGTMNDIKSSLNDVDSYNVDVWDLDESKSSDYNIGMFDEDRHNDIMVSQSGNKEKVSPDSYRKLVESRGAFLLRGSGPPITGNRHVVSSKGVEERNQLLISSSLNSNIFVANSNNNNSVNDLSGFNVDPGSNDMSTIKSNPCIRTRVG